MPRAVLIFLAFASAAASNCHGDECHDETSFVQVKTSVQVNRGHPEDAGDMRDAIQQEVEEGKRELRAYAEGLQDAHNGEPDDTPQDYDEAGTEASRSLINARGSAFKIYNALNRDGMHSFESDVDWWPTYAGGKVDDACLKDAYGGMNGELTLANCGAGSAFLDARQLAAGTKLPKDTKGVDLPCNQCLENQWAVKAGKKGEAGTGFSCCSNLAKADLEMRLYVDCA